MDKDERTKRETHKFSSGLESAVRRIKSAATWKHLACAQDTLIRLRNICSDLKPGKGMICLFAGESGTGRTLAAEVIANELRMDLLRIDLSAVVSKYIGETEKNLGRIFEEAGTSNAVLFFEEADALFGKRSEVKDSHDRFANVEINYLLQRMQAYPGLAVLATNRRQMLDAAFLRRFRFIVEFPGPQG